MNKNPFLKRLMKGVEAKDVLHSSGYAAAPNMGATSTQSFSERREIDQNRLNVRAYGDSELGGALNQQKAKQYNAEVGRKAMGAMNRPSSMSTAPQITPTWKNPGISR